MEIFDDALQRWHGSEHPASDAWITRRDLHFGLHSLRDYEKAAVRDVYLSPFDKASAYIVKWAKPLAQGLRVHPMDLKMIVILGGPRPTTEAPMDNSDTTRAALIPVLQSSWIFANEELAD
ncbi:hypothetical protein FA95DRAFT_1601852 [Auriscalpium vulgare]|uniref:Uncharacterized protein n=1 Tax=Auriscalpium vulgare TaxID=40419 RepID=A0ACB8S8I4_9AGAM|nr:hypothetical protein FA95DRAFT_1601852 [Auriscalpium vulgare]